MQLMSSFSIDNWSHQFEKNQQQAALSDFESGKILYYPQLNFKIYPEEKQIFLPVCLNKKTKNISYNIHTDCLQGLKTHKKYQQTLKIVLKRFAEQTDCFMKAVFPHYSQALQLGRTSYRPAQIKGRKTSPRKDDSRLHVDAFPSNPNHGKRIFRLFSNINPYNEPRLWHVGEPFAEVANYFLAKVSKPKPMLAKLLFWAGITKSLRSPYDHVMLQIHDRMKLDAFYQRKVKATKISFPSGCSWIVSTDQVSHAALSGQFVLEQTFYLPVSAMLNPLMAPLKVLENLIGHKLV